MNIKEIEPTTKNISEYIFEGDLNIVINELVNLIFKESNEGKDEEIIKQHVLNYNNDHKITSQEIYHWLLNNQNNSNSVYLIGYFNYYGIDIDFNKQKAIELYQKAADLENSAAQLDLAYMYTYGKIVEKNNKAFELSKQLAERGYAGGINRLGYCYERGIGTDVDKRKAFELFQKAADLGNSTGVSNLGCCYSSGIGIDIDEQKAFELFQKAADLENANGITNLGYCYNNGIGTGIDKQKAFELYQKAANLGNYLAQYNLALMYENGDEIKEDIDQAIYWYKKCAEQGDEDAQNKLEKLSKK